MLRMSPASIRRCTSHRYYWEQLFPTTDEALAAHYNGSGARDNRVAQVILLLLKHI